MELKPQVKARAGVCGFMSVSDHGGAGGGGGGCGACMLALRLAVLNCVAAIPGEFGRKTRGGLVDPPEIVDLPEAASCALL